ncbi:MAG TPA: DUF4394 domain-containing protein [Pirellula sp.]|nr:DUF4394 domain-containing protein [Pirellula sp.]
MKNQAYLLSIVLSLAILSQANAELISAVTSARSLISFDSATPGTIISSLGITGFQDVNEGLNDIDYRPSNGVLYVMGNAPGSIYRLYTMNTATAVLSKVGADITGLTGTFKGFDFNPVADLLRITTDSDQNFRFNASTGLLAGTDTNLAYAAGDSGAGVNPNIVGSAYNNNVAGAATTTLFNIDSGRDVLVQQNPPNNGTLITVGALGVDFQNFTGFDISGQTGTAYATTTNAALTLTNLYTINLATGTSTLVGQVGSNLVINDFSVRAVPEPSSLALLSISALAFVRVGINRRKLARTSIR